MSDEERPAMVVEEEELFSTSQPIAPLSPLRQDDANEGPRQSDLFGDEQVEGQSETEEKKDEQKPKKVRKPRVVLNEERLMGKNGIRKLPDLFKKVKFKGKSHESEDLHLLLKEMEHWAHIMVPRQQFSDVIDKLELLGAKKIVKGHARSVQSGTLITENDETENVTGLEAAVDGGSGNNDVGQTAPQIYGEMANSTPVDDIDALLNEDFGDIDFEDQEGN